MRYVRYIGLAHQRMINPHDWRTVGIGNGPTVVWNAFNGFSVPLDQFSEDMIRKAIDPDPNFVITGEGEDQDEEFVPTPQHRDMTPAELDQAVNNPVDVPTLVEQGSIVSTGLSAPSTDAAPNGPVSADRREDILDDNQADEAGGSTLNRSEQD